MCKKQSRSKRSSSYCRLELAVAILQRHIEYHALCYNRGEPVCDRSLQVNDSTHGITDTLFNALCHIRYTDRPRYLWVDALCIYQQDIDERPRQMAGMLSIYRKADRVIVWPGPEGTYTRMCRRFAEHAQSFPRRTRGNWNRFVCEALR